MSILCGMDYQSALYDPIYLIDGVPVTLTLESVSEPFDQLTALDKTAGVDVGDSVHVQTIRPAATLRVKELASFEIALDDLPGATLEMNEFEWIVQSYRVKPSPKGENDGEVLLLLTDKTPVSTS